MIETPIIKSILDQDLYSFTVGQVAFQHFPGAVVKYQFINRGKTQFPEGFADELQNQLQMMKSLQLSKEESGWLLNLKYLSGLYIHYLSNYRFDPDQITIKQTGGDLSAEFQGDWASLIMWEVPFLALVSELYYKLTGKVKDKDWKGRILAKGKLLSDNGSTWIDFGTRRRFDFEAQDAVVSLHKTFDSFRGTSNMLLAMKHNVPVNGTMSHQGPMAMQALFGVVDANKKWREYWRKTYGPLLNTFLPDTFTTEVFFRDFMEVEAKQWNLRQDSGNPYRWMKMCIDNYTRLGETPTLHTWVFSDSLDPKKFNAITNEYYNYSLIGGIGTNLSNDCGHPAVSIVIKLSQVFYFGWVDVVKLSDDPVKHTGTPEAIAKAKKELGLL